MLVHVDLLEVGYNEKGNWLGAADEIIPFRAGCTWEKISSLL
jgi:hypothetical protein